MPLAPARRAPALGLAAMLAVHALLLLGLQGRAPPAVPPAASDQALVWLNLAPMPEAVPEPSPAPAPPATPRAATAAPPPPALREEWTPQAPAVLPAAPPASRAAPPAPSAEEWAFAGQYTLKNSKAYRHSWGQQIRSMMGTAVEGPDQGAVRFRVEIAADGRLARLETLWSTSPVAERLARKAVEAMPRWPATPTGQPLVFERTIAFSAFAHDDPPLYKDDCLPDPPEFKNPFAWDGHSQRTAAAPQPQRSPPDPQALADCLKQLPRDSMEAEEAQDRRLLEQWASPRLGR